MSASPRLLVVAHGTASEQGTATTERLLAAIRTENDSVDVDLCYLDVAEPRLPDALDERPAVVVPLLLSTGYHVQSDIPAATVPWPQTRVARHLGPHPLLADALIDRLGVVADDVTVMLAGAGSTRPEAAVELAQMAELLGARLRRDVQVITMADDVRAALGRCSTPMKIATYLLTEGAFVDRLRAAAQGIATVADPLGVHPALIRLVWTRYTDALAAERI